MNRENLKALLEGTLEEANRSSKMYAQTQKMNEAIHKFDGKMSDIMFNEEVHTSEISKVNKEIKKMSAALDAISSIVQKVSK